jgi:hypothetical protein
MPRQFSSADISLTLGGKHKPARDPTLGVNLECADKEPALPRKPPQR